MLVRSLARVAAGPKNVSRVMRAVNAVAATRVEAPAGYAEAAAAATAVSRQGHVGSALAASADPYAELERLPERHIARTSVQYDSAEEVREKMDKHVLATWGVKDDMFPAAKIVSHGEGVRAYDRDGREYLDMCSQAVCCNLGHTVPMPVMAAVQQQMQTIPMVYGGFFIAEPRVKLAEELAEIAPEGIEAFLFPLNGSEANEAAMRIAQRVTGRAKILSSYRSYHGATGMALAATGDGRTQFSTGFSYSRKFMDPNPYLFDWGSCPEQRLNRSLGLLEQTIICEGSQTVAAIILEPVVGANGFVRYPDGYLSGVRRLCDKYGILLISDEVMMGFGRTGYWFGIDSYVNEPHGKRVRPDIITSAKGLTCGILPLSLVGVSQDVHATLRKLAVGWGSTYQAHNVCVAAGLAVVQHMKQSGLVERARMMEPVFRREVRAIVADYPDILMNPRTIGFGASFDVRRAGEVSTEADHPFRGLQQQPCPDVHKKLKGALMEEGVLCHMMGPHVNLAPPLIATEQEIVEGFQRVRRAIDRSIAMPYTC